jgi:methionyl-tRNA formyltransferase
LNKLKIIFIGGLSNGKIVLNYLQSNKYVDIPLIITHPNDHQAPRYIDLSTVDNVSDIKKDLDANIFLRIIKNLKPDIIFVAGWSGLLSKELISIPRLGTVGFHPSQLPMDRGRSVLAWQIEEGYTETGLSMFYYDELPDCGDIIGQEKIKIEHNDYINDVLNKIDDATYNLMRAYFPLIRKDVAPKKPQKINEGNFRRLRTNKDSIIDWDKNAEIILNKIRAISKPYPGAIGKINKIEYHIWKAIPCNTIDELDQKPFGSYIFEEKIGFPIIKCRDKCIKILDYEKI